LTRITTLADPEAVAVRAAREIATALQRAVEQHGHAHLALSGGGTPERTYELLAETMESWEAVHVWFADERCVPPDDEQSNYRMAAQTLLDRVSLPPERIHRMLGELGPEQGAEDYAGQLRAGLGGERDVAPPALDLIVLGIGPDGHVASLFPGASTLDTGAHELCLAVHDSPKPPPERITLSLAVLAAARRCVLIATGPSKADAISAALATPTKHVPASLLRRERLTVIVDDRAAPTAPIT
jgi:6-phosphogluconolactonase